MQFENPQALWGLLLLLIPLILHLFGFRLARKRIFTQIPFLLKAQKQLKSVRSIQKRWILLTRLLLLLFLVLLFAGPVWNPGVDAREQAVQRTQIWLDNSPSMGLAGTGGKGLDLAKTWLLKTRPDWDQGRTVQVMDNRLVPLLQNGATGAELVEWLPQVQARGAHLNGDILLSRLRTLDPEPGVQRILLSDFGMPAPTKPLEGSGKWGLISTASEKMGKAWIDSVWLERPILMPGVKNRLMLACRSGNMGESVREIRLYSGEMLRSSAVLEPMGQRDGMAGEPGGYQNWEQALDFIPERAGYWNGTVELWENQELAHRMFLAGTPSSQAIVQVGARSGAMPLLAAVFGSETWFKVEQRARPEPDPRIEVYVHDGSALSADMPIWRHVREQGGLLMLLPAGTQEAGALRPALKGLGLPYPGEQSFALDWRWDWDDAAWDEILERRSKDKEWMNSAQVLTLEGPVPHRVLARAQDGRPVLGLAPYGKGWVLISGLPLSQKELLRSPYFAPLLVHLSLKWVDPDPLYFTLGTLGRKRLAGVRTEKAVLSNGSDSMILQGRPTEGGTWIEFPELELDPGLYTLRWRGEEGQKGEQTWALNTDPAERRDMGRMTEWKAWALNNEVSWNQFLAGGEPILDNWNRTGVPLWKGCLILALLMLSMETWLLRNWTRNKASQA